MSMFCPILPYPSFLSISLTWILSSGIRFTKGLKASTLPGLVQDVVKTAATHQEHVQMMKNFEEALKADQLTLEPGCGQVFENIADKMQELRDKTRRGSTKDFEKLVAGRLVELGSKLLTVDNPPIVSTDIDSFLKVCSCFTLPQTRDLQAKLVGWATKYKKVLACADLIGWCSSYVKSCDAQAYPEKIPVDAKQVRAYITKLPNPTPPEVAARLTDVVLPFVIRVFLEAN